MSPQQKALKRAVYFGLTADTRALQPTKRQGKPAAKSWKAVDQAIGRQTRMRATKIR